MSPEPCVYIVDDDEAVRDSLSALLESKAYAVRSFVSAPKFLAAAPSLPVGCLIVDIRMPEMDGLELQQRLVEHGLDFTLIVITGHGEVPLAVRNNASHAVVLDGPSVRGHLRPDDPLLEAGRTASPVFQRQHRGRLVLAGL